MYMHSDYPKAKDYDVINLNTGERIPKCQWANDESGKYCIYMTNKDGSLLFDKNEVVTIIKKGNIKVQKK